MIKFVMEPIEATIFVPIIAQYTEEELSKMSETERLRARAYGLFKIVGEEHPITLKTSDREQMRTEVIELCKQYDPRPLFVKLNSTLNRTFLVDNRYYADDPDAILEIVHFSCSDTAEQILEFISSKDADYMYEFRSRYGMIDFPFSLWQKWRRWVHRKALKQLNDKYNEDLSHELHSRFGFRGPLKKEVFGQALKLYMITSEIHAQDQGHVDISMVLDEYIEEKGRFVQKGMRFHSLQPYFDYLAKVHPELMGPRAWYNTKNHMQERQREILLGTL